VNGIEFDDPRGDDEQENPIVAAQNVLLGLYYDGVWFWGPQSITGNRLPSANWEAQMDKCDVLIPLDGGGSEKRFRFGLEVSVDQVPHAVIGELLKGCEGRIAEIGGIYKVLVGEPDAPVASFTDEDIVITEGQTYEPFPGLESTYNAITANYPEPAEAWQNKEAPPRYNSTLELADDARRLPFSTSYKSVPFPNQVQRLMRAAIEEARRFRRHSHTAPPEWWEYEPLDSVVWDSDRNGYVAKEFLITVMEDLPAGNQVVGLHEIDPADYDWETAFELPWDTAPLIIARPAPQPMTGWAVAPYVHVDAADDARRPGIEVGFAGTLVDVRAVRVQVRRSGEMDPFFDGEFPYDPTIASPVVYIVANPILPNQPYEVRGIFLPFSGRETLWSAWLAVTTPDIRLGPDDIVPLTVLGGDVLQQMAAIRTLIEQFKLQGTLLEEADRENFHLRNTLVREISVQLGDLQASFTEIIEVALGPGGAIATALESLYAAMGGNTAEVNVRWEAVAAPSGYTARYAVQAAVNDGSFRAATFFLDVPEDTGEPTRIGFAAGQTVFFTSGGDPIALMDESGHFKSANGVVDIDMIGGDFSITVPD
jgi:hypothetical protein